MVLTLHIFICQKSLLQNMRGQRTRINRQNVAYVQRSQAIDVGGSGNITLLSTLLLLIRSFLSYSMKFLSYLARYQIRFRQGSQDHHQNHLASIYWLWLSLDSLYCWYLAEPSCRIFLIFPVQCMYYDRLQEIFMVNRSPALFIFLIRGACGNIFIALF